MKTTERREFEDLALPLLDSAYRTALRLSGRPAAAEDLVQEAFLRAFRGFAQFQRGSNFKAWFFRILTNTFLNEYRRSTHEPKTYDFTEADPVDPAGAPAAFRVDQVDELRKHLGDEAARAVDRLPVEFRLAFLLSAFEGFPYKDIAEILSIPIGTVMSRLFRARRMLREDLMEYAVASGFLKDRDTA